MKYTIAVLVLALAPVVHAESAWRWTDARGTVHYSNLRGAAPDDAVAVTTEISHAPHATADEPDAAPAPGRILIGGAPSEARPVGRKLRPIYDEERLHFGCYSAGVLYFGG